MTRTATDSDVAAAYGAALGEVLGFYGTMIVRDFARELAAARARRESRGARWMGRTAARTAHGILIEFGAAELLDSAVIRPLAMGLAMRVLGPAWGLPAGKIIADVTFYLVAAASYEANRRSTFRPWRHYGASVARLRAQRRPRVDESR